MFTLQTRQTREIARARQGPSDAQLSEAPIFPASCSLNRGRMVELFKTNDLVLISAIEAFLTSAGVSFSIADQHMSATEGSLGFLPRRFMVEAGQANRARDLIRAAGFDCDYTYG